MTTHIWLVLAWVALVLAGASTLLAPSFGKLTWHFWVALAAVLYLVPQVLA